MGLWPFSRGATVSVAESSSALAAGDAVLLDVRERSEFGSAHLWFFGSRLPRLRGFALIVDREQRRAGTVGPPR